MTVYVQYDPSTADASQHVTAFSTVSIPDPQVATPTQQLILPDGTVTAGMMIDLSQNPPTLIPIPPSPSPVG
jgi:hypothetical protein